MSYYKSTSYYGPNSQDLSDNSDEARAERKSKAATVTAIIPDAKNCLSCGIEAPAGYLWYQGICKDCKNELPQMPSA